MISDGCRVSRPGGLPPYPLTHHSSPPHLVIIPVFLRTLDTLALHVRIIIHSSALGVEAETWYYYQFCASGLDKSTAQ